ncbi:MAG: nucleoside triphosphate pyrophosphohydrolase [Bacteroidales bacterium]|nr:nucleoside triphosphate pyrophosphohydrolase [Bacteroidales bacterium]
MTEQVRQQSALQRLSDILDRLRQECPWDREQTLQSLRYLSIEEVYELSEAIIAVTEHPNEPKFINDLRKELGDILLHIFFYAKIASDEGFFALADVADAVSDKLVSRHPHIFGNGEQVPWEKVKMKEGRKSVLEGVPCSLPPLVKAVRMQEKAEGIGYTDPDKTDSVIPAFDEKNVSVFSDSHVFGDALLQLLHQAHRHGINADDALSAANLRYQHRVEQWEQNQKRNSSVEE